MTKRFKATSKNLSKDCFATITDDYCDSPITKIPFKDINLAGDVADWLNHNIIEYKQFVLREYLTSNGIPAYQVWDNKNDKGVPFRPTLSNSRSPKTELKAYVDWLNSLVEGSEK